MGGPLNEGAIETPVLD